MLVGAGEEAGGAGLGGLVEEDQFGVAVDGGDGDFEAGAGEEIAGGGQEARDVVGVLEDVEVGLVAVVGAGGHQEDHTGAGGPVAGGDGGDCRVGANGAVIPNPAVDPAQHSNGAGS